MLSSKFYPQRSEEVQIKGRTARQGKKGSFALVLNAEDLVRFDIDAEEVRQPYGGRGGGR